MADAWRLFLLLEAAEIEEENIIHADHLRIRRERKLLRDNSNPFDLNEEHFRKMFRFSRDVARNLCNTLAPQLERFKTNGLSVETKVLAALRFYASGSYQLSVGQNILVAMSQSSVSRCVGQVTAAINGIMSEHMIHFPVTEREKAGIKQRFMQEYGFPGVIGSIDCTHVAIFPPPANNPEMPENIFVNRKGTHSINVQLICGPDLRIYNVNARYGGSTHDAFIWRHSSVREQLYNQYQVHGRASSWLLGDSGYPLEPWLLTPVINPLPETPEYFYSARHSSARSCVERCNGVLKMRFRCLSKHRVLHYLPPKAADIILACAVLHNIAIEARIPLPEEDDDGNEIDGDAELEHENVPCAVNGHALTEGRRVRNAVIRQHFT